MYEHEFYNVEREIAAYNNISLPDKLKLDFKEPEYPKTVQDQILKDEFDLKNNLTTRAKIMVRDNKDITLNQAQNIIDENKSNNGQEIVEQPDGN